MERSGVEPKRPKVAFWGGSRDSEGGDLGQTEYISRLTSLRDSLIDQEQLNLAQALDRLRLHSLSNKSSSYRLRMTSQDDVNKSQPIRRNMVTTVEKFRQMRPKRPVPVILPLQGKPLLEPAQVRPSSSDGEGTNGYSAKDSIIGDITARSVPSKVEETVQTNLQRLIQPTSSIPNIGRKALKHQESLELKSKSLFNMRNRVHRQSGASSLRPFLSPANSASSPSSSHAQRSQGQSCANSPLNGSPGMGEGGSSLSPQTYKLGPFSLGDAINMDTLQEYCYRHYLGQANGVGERGREAGGGGGGGGGLENEGLRPAVQFTSFSSPASRPDRRLMLQRRGGQKRYSHHAQSYAAASAATSSSSSFSPAKSRGRLVDRRSNCASQHSEPANGPAYLVDRPGTSDSSEFHHYFQSADESDTDTYTGSQTTVQRLPSVHNGEARTHQTAYRYPRMKSFEEAVDPLERELSCEEDSNLAGSMEAPSYRMRIVIDMPSIVFNAASPEQDSIPTERKGTVSAPPNRFHEPGQGQIPVQGQGQFAPSPLRKTVKQQEIRKRELHNLLEDVRELNQRSEALSGQPTPTLGLSGNLDP